MKIKVTPIADSVNEDVIKRFEEALGSKLPEDYRGFMLDHNGGDPEERCVFKLKGVDGPYSESLVRYLFAFSAETDESIEYNYEVYTLAKRLPENILPIGEDPGGNLICLSFQGEDAGKVYFWDHEQEGLTESSSTYSNLQIIADNFYEFIDGLEEESY
ncbi:SMI1/KNR4 family protein [Pseudomonas sp. EA_35y_Pfl2_R111]|uniref:SMI1/KNR4 family protein n=1 Tax=Pseudomonas sp. EA_35y_Pfl2_R111 TaxID=3088689 RepID=UPI0030D87360